MNVAKAKPNRSLRRRSGRPTREQAEQLTAHIVDVATRLFLESSFETVSVDLIAASYKSDTFPTTSYGMAHNLEPALAAKIKEAFLTFPWEGSALKAEFKTEDRFVPITYQKDWSVIRKIDAASGVKYTCK